MNMDTQDLLEIPKPIPPRKLSNLEILMGRPLKPIDKLKLISPNEFEEMVVEWLNSYLIEKYERIRKCGGAGDMGRDVIAFAKYSKNREELVWDNYQCKHYDNPLSPSNVWVEFGKVCYYSYRKAFTVPRKYYFVTTKGVGQALADILDSPEGLKKGLVANWDKYCMKKITKLEDVLLEGEFKEYIESFDFSIFDSIEPNDLIEQYMQTPYFSFRFGGGLHKPRPIADAPPENIDKKEMIYVSKLLEAYSEHLGEKIGNVNVLDKNNRMKRHFNRQRTYYYKADSLMKFERDSLPTTSAFEELKDEILDGIIDIVESENHKDAYARVVAVTQEARKLVINTNALSSVVDGNDKSGICHHLANENDEIRWVIKNEE
ncbi:MULTISPECIES: ABC-three component system protein [Bacillus]|uniref:ABC-three component systems C-terminal domain-containing protein n=1 Tax=Bacillus wiedmannii TaxID=1890302 RepID=A0A2C4PS77_9BACI|nr:MULTISPECIES: ABC-three component system protein [Bacillus cereus group]PFE12523.1 hypothetical protein CN303_11550 [Bacillus thuringiensis]PGE36702.1 hypothetical protein COM60_20960 [Bacillus toyonensis]PHD02815.1 hypothetical protein COF44_03375 [Bacillus toyonensis]PHD55419.1 hypothetical protein COF57_30175 [Bacillus wiedmannii]